MRIGGLGKQLTTKNMWFKNKKQNEFKIDSVVDANCIKELDSLHAKLTDLKQIESSIKSLKIQELNAISAFIQAHNDGMGGFSVKEATAKGLEIIKSL